MNRLSTPLAVDVTFLQSIALFGGLMSDSLERVAGHLERRVLPPGENVVTVGEGAREMYIVEEGEVEVVARRQHPGSEEREPEPGTECELILAVLRRGSCFGEMSLLDIQPRSATVRTRESATLLVLSYGDLQHLQDTDPTAFTILMMNLAREVSRRLRVVNRVLVEVLLRLHDSITFSYQPTAITSMRLN